MYLVLYGKLHTFLDLRIMAFRQIKPEAFFVRELGRNNESDK